MNNSTIQPEAPAAAQTSVAPVATQVEGLTPEQARARLSELKSDKEFGAKLIKTWDHGSAERHLWDALERRSLELPAEEAKAEPTEQERALQALQPPATAEDYKLLDPVSGYPLRLDPENTTIVRGELLPAAHALGLSQGDINMAAFGVVKPQTYEQCESSLRRVWGKGFDQGNADLKAALQAQPQAAALLEKYPDTLGSNAGLIMRIVEAYRLRLRRTRR
jgi:hypothetical protein